MTLKEFCKMVKARNNCMYPCFELYTMMDGKQAFLGEISPCFYDTDNRIQNFGDWTISAFPCSKTSFGVEVIVPSEDSGPSSENIVDALFTSVWDGGASVITTSCKVNMVTKEVFDIEEADESTTSAVTTLDRQYITLGDGREFPVYSVEDVDPDDFWY